MQRRRLGKTDLHVSPLGLGTVKFGRNQGVKYPTGFDLPTEAELADLLALARDLGINLLDTAPAYGLSEERLGRLLQGQRDHWVIVGKAGEEFIDGQSHYDFSPAHIQTSLERSLQRLQTDHLDVLMIHSDGNDIANLSDDVIATLHELRARGLARAIGASTKTADGGQRAVAALDVVMATYHPAYTDERPVLDAAAQVGKGVLLKKVLASGHVNTIANEDPVRASLQFAFDHPGTTAAIVGTINPDHLKANVHAMDRTQHTE